MIATLIEDIRALPTRLLVSLGLAAGLLIGYEVWAHHERSIGEESCKAAQKVKQDKIDALQAELDQSASAKAQELTTRYHALDSALAKHETPSPIPGCDRVPIDWLRDVNQAHARP